MASACVVNLPLCLLSHRFDPVVAFAFVLGFGSEPMVGLPYFLKDALVIDAERR